nr:MAG TPA: hypothetical protein [Caudoviricetes sp.]
MYILTTLNTLFNIARTILGYFLQAKIIANKLKKESKTKFSS